MHEDKTRFGSAVAIVVSQNKVGSTKLECRPTARSFRRAWADPS